MNILTGEDMIHAGNAAYCLVYETEDALRLLECAWDRFFGSFETKPLDVAAAQEVGTVLRVCCDRISTSLLEFRLSVGEEGASCDAYFSQTADYQEAAELQRLNNSAIDREKTLSGADCKAFTARRMEALRLPAPLGVKALRGLLQEGGKNA